MRREPWATNTVVIAQVLKILLMSHEDDMTNLKKICNREKRVCVCIVLALFVVDMATWVKKFGQGPPRPFSGNARKKSFFYGRCSLIPSRGSQGPSRC